ncbi:MAG: hypothetical protein PUB34_03300 [Clostridia bacterium]|nr:hypothetical protein [Clostridia bacterium]
MENNNDMSSDELLRKLKETLGESSDFKSKIDENLSEIELPEEQVKEESEQDKESVLLKRRQKASSMQSDAVKDPSLSYKAHSSGEAAPDAELYEAASAVSKDELKAATRDPIKGLDSRLSQTKDFEIEEIDFPDEPIPDLDEVDIDAVAKKYLSAEEIAAGDSEDADARTGGDVAQQLSEAVEYVASIENQKSQEEPKEPQTETQKVLADLDLQSISNGDEELDEVDVNLMIAFGMADELEEKLGKETVNDVAQALDKDAEILEKAKEDVLSTELPDDMEFISNAQIKDVFAVYRRKRAGLRIKLLGTFVMSVIIFIFEHFEALGGSYSTFLEPTSFPVVHSMVSLQLLFICLAFVWKPILSGLANFFTFKPRTDSVLALAALVTVFYHIGVCFLYDGSRVIYCDFAVAVGAFVYVICEAMSVRRDIRSFKIISSKRIKYVLNELPADAASPERDAFADYIAQDEPIFGVKKASFVDGFFRRSRKSSKGIPALRAMLPIPVALALFFFVFSGIIGNNADIYSGIISAYTAFMLATPFSALIGFTVPFFRASKIAFEEGGAIIGEDSIDEYACASAISFEDKEVFPSGKVKIRSIKVYDNNRIDRIIYNLASLFVFIGGPLADVFRIATKDMGCSDDVEIVDIADDGIEAVISGKHIFYGRKTFLEKNNLEPYYDEEDDYGFGRDCSIAYLVCNDKVAAKLYIQYAIDPGFDSIAKQLYRSGICLGIKTFDPNIDDEMLSGYVDLEKYPIKVIKMYNLPPKAAGEDNADSGIVSKKNTKSLLKTLSLCSNISHASHTGMFVSVLSVIIAFAISIFAVLKTLLSEPTMMGLYVVLYQLFWTLPTLITSRLTIKH